MQSKYHFAFKLSAFLVMASLFFSFKPEGWQEVKPDAAAGELLEINKKILSNVKYSFEVSYSTFKSHNDENTYEINKGRVTKDGNMIYSCILGITTIQNKKIRVAIDSSKKIVKVSNPIEGQDPSFNLEDYLKVIKSCKSIKRRQTKEEVAYRFEPKGEKGIVAQEFYMGQQFLNKSVIYYINDYSVRENNKINTQTVYPRMEITISNFKKLEKIGKEIFETNNIVSVSGDKLELTEKYKNFKLFDGRFNK